MSIHPRTLEPGKGSVDACADEGETDAAPPTPSLVHFVLENFAFAMLTSLTIFVVVFSVTWLTIIQDARLMIDQVLSNETGVSLPPCFY